MLKQSGWLAIDTACPIDTACLTNKLLLLETLAYCSVLSYSIRFSVTQSTSVTHSLPAGLHLMSLAKSCPSASVWLRADLWPIPCLQDSIWCLWQSPLHLYRGCCTASCFSSSFSRTDLQQSSPRQQHGSAFSQDWSWLETASKCKIFCWQWKRTLIVFKGDPSHETLWCLSVEMEQKIHTHQYFILFL